jgi:hypothetical protein
MVQLKKLTAGPSPNDTYLMLINAENFKLAFELAARFSFDPKLVLEELADKCGKDPQFAVSTGWDMLRK